jgi:hypothetical protein
METVEEDLATTPLRSFGSERKFSLKSQKIRSRDKPKEIVHPLIRLQGIYLTRLIRSPILATDSSLSVRRYYTSTRCKVL